MQKNNDEIYLFLPLVFDFFSPGLAIAFDVSVSLLFSLCSILSLTDSNVENRYISTARDANAASFCLHFVPVVYSFVVFR